jgi:hypothetical protein
MVASAVRVTLLLLLLVWSARLATAEAAPVGTLAQPSFVIVVPAWGPPTQPWTPGLAVIPSRPGCFGPPTIYRRHYWTPVRDFLWGRYRVGYPYHPYPAHP